MADELDLFADFEPPKEPEPERPEISEAVVEAYETDEVEEAEPEAPAPEEIERSDPGLGKQIRLFDAGESEAEHGKYTVAVGSPVYVPKGRRPHVLTLAQPGKADSLARRIRAAEGIDEDERKFLLRAAERHVVFDYESIAEYYAHASPAMQRLMEESALVIVDVDSAIENGYVQLSNTIRRLYLEMEANANGDS